MTDTREQRIEALRWAAEWSKQHSQLLNEAIPGWHRFDGPDAPDMVAKLRDAVELWGYRERLFARMADELEADEADERLIEQRTVDAATEWRSAEEFERALREAKP